MRDRAREKEIIAKATPGPWEAKQIAHYDHSNVLLWTDTSKKGVRTRRVDISAMGLFPQADAEFIALARTGWPEDFAWRERAERVLKNIEWLYFNGESVGFYFCPCCKNVKMCGHELDCKLAALLPKEEKTR